MGLLDSLEQAAGIGAQATAGGPGVVSSVLRMLQSQPGGLAGVIHSFEAAGLGGVANSWLGSGANLPISSDQVQTALGQGPVGQIAQALGLPHDAAAAHIARLLPLIVDHLSPNGAAPAGDTGARLEGLLNHFTAR